MGKIDNLSGIAFNSGMNFNKQNTFVCVSDNIVRMYLHGNLIAEKNLKTLQTRVTCAGWNTRTTRNRLNGIGANICVKKGLLYSNCKQFSANEWINI